MFRRTAVTIAVLALGVVTAVMWGGDALRPPPRAEAASFVAPQPVPFAVTPALLAEPPAAGTLSTATLVAQLDALVADDALGDRVGLAVAVLGSDDLLYARSPGTAITPASSLKIVTSAAALQLLGADARFTTQVVAGSSADQIVLVGGGDPSLTTADTPFIPGGESLEGLARKTAAVLLERGTSTVELGYDSTLFTGPAVDSDWRDTYISGDVVAPVTALQVDGGRLEPGFAARADDPALDAATEFAAMLREHGVTVAGSPMEQPGGGEVVAEIVSPALADIVEYVLATSDNDTAENLARHVALAGSGEASSDAAPEATRSAMDAIGVDMSGAALLDGSGLARGNAVSAQMLVRTLNAAADPANPDLRPVLSGLPVASFNGTLAERVAGGEGAVRAKTGTLTGVTSLSGTVLGADGVTYVFSALADNINNTLEARDVMDQIAAAISQCGCG